jgi:hypothetical protein
LEKWLPTFSFSPLKRSCSNWQSSIGGKAGEKDHELEKAAFEAGEAIRNKANTALKNLEAIVRWKSERECPLPNREQRREDPARAGRSAAVARVVHGSGREGICSSCMAWIFPWRRRFWPRSIPSAIHGARLPRA